MGSFVEFARGARPSDNDYKSWSDIKIVITVPSSIDASGKLFVSVNDKKTNEVDYKIIGFPIITDVNPDSVHKGDTMTIKVQGSVIPRVQAMLILAVTRDRTMSFGQMQR